MRVTIVLLPPPSRDSKCDALDVGSAETSKGFVNDDIVWKNYDEHDLIARACTMRG
jgi:hypothetical protein